VVVNDIIDFGFFFVNLLVGNNSDDIENSNGLFLTVNGETMCLSFNVIDDGGGERSSFVGIKESIKFNITGSNFIGGLLSNLD
jgi:hypothetical protein